MLRPVILAGGSGTRLWPLSRQSYPKQFLQLFDNQHTLVQETVLRLKNIENVAPPIVICNEQHYFICSDQLNAIHVNADYILEPIGKNTAPAVAIAAWQEVLQEKDPYLLVMPSDHLIKDPKAFAKAIGFALEAAKQDYLITFAITPTQPETGYGYIEQGNALDSGNVYHVAGFIEKPSLAQAEKLLTTGKHFWNSGIFLFKASVYLKELKQHARDIYDATSHVLQATTQQSPIRLPLESFARCRSESIDYAVMEKTKHAATVPLSVGWSDLGSWNAVSMFGNMDSNDNVIQGDVLAYNTHNCFINATDKLVATAGLNDHIVISTSDSVLVAHKDYAQSVKTLVQELQKIKHKTTDTHTKVYRPWGSYESINAGPHFQVKRIIVNPGGRLSLQLHHHRSEHWIVVEGAADVIRGEEHIELQANQHIYIPKETKHRLSNTSNTPLVIIETQYGDYLGEDDIVRFDDIYCRPIM